jgi:hypothetical protein
LALAESALKPQPETLPAHIDSLSARYESGHLRGDFVHQREEARFDLALVHKPQAALQLAQLNWQAQHETADIKILLESALAAGDTNAARPALNFIQTNHLEDVALAKLTTQLTHP